MRILGTSPWPCTNACVSISRETLYGVLHHLEPAEVVTWLALEARGVWNEPIDDAFVRQLSQILPHVAISEHLASLVNRGWLTRLPGGSYEFARTLTMGDDLAKMTEEFLSHFPVESGAAAKDSQAHFEECDDCNPIYGEDGGNDCLEESDEDPEVGL